MDYVFAVYFKAFQKVPDEAKMKYKPFVRYETKKYKKWKFKFAAVFLFPYRITFLILSLLCWIISLKWATRGITDLHKPLPQDRRDSIIKWGRFWNRFIVYFMGGHGIVEYHKAKFEDYDPEYKEMDETIDHTKPPMIISNH